MSRSESLVKSWKNRKDYIGEDKKSSLYISWRARVFTKKGRIQGYPDIWGTFQGFKKEMLEGWEEGKILVRKNTKLPFSKENCEWAKKGTENIGKLVRFEYNGETKTLMEWAKELGLNYNGIRQRYFKGKNYTKEQILYGKSFKRKADVRDYRELEYQTKRNKISKMLSAYRLKDKKHNRFFNLSREYFENNILSKSCAYCGSTENVGCDRIDNAKGHTTDNVIPACYVCNTVRSNHFTVNEMKDVGEVIAKIIKNRYSEGIICGGQNGRYR